MKWFEGTIPEAIRLSKTRQSLFVVYVAGDDSDSLKLSQSFDDATVCQAFQEANCVAIKLQNRSEPGVQFSQIYPVVLVPCVFFIGENGVPVEVTAGYQPPNELIVKLNKALQLNRRTLPEQPLQAPQATDSTSNVEDYGATASARRHPDEDVQESSSSISLAEKQERANQLIARKREEKIREEEEKEKLQELQRRKLGQEMAKLKQLKEEQEKKEIDDAYKKKKEDERLAREKVRADIERDRQERALKFHQEKADRETAAAKQQAEKIVAQAEAEARVNAAKMKTARIQFRLPDASTITHVFPSSDSLTSLRSFILQRMPSTCQGVTLSTIYPKRLFTETDFSSSLLQLELAPSAVIVVLPSIGSSNRRPEDVGVGVLAPFWWLLAQIMALWTVICNFLFASPSPQQQQNLNEQQSHRNDGQQRPAHSDSDLRRRPLRSEAVKRHVDGNIHRLTADDSDDESATWNGNSTQQM